MLQLKDTDWLNGYKHKTHTNAVYKKTYFRSKETSHWKWEDRKIYSIQMGNKRRLE